MLSDKYFHQMHLKDAVRMKVRKMELFNTNMIIYQGWIHIICLLF